MNSPKLINRKLFLSFTVSSTAAFLVGCGSDTSGPITPSGGAGGAGPSGGAGGSTAGAGGAAAGAPGAGAGGSAAGAPSAGAGGSAAGSSGAGGASGGSAGSAGSGGNGGSGGAPVAANCGTMLRTMVTGNHGHVISITAADVTAGVSKIIDTKGTSTHSHFIQFTAADFTTLSNGGTVRKLSCNDGHEHEFIVNCIGVDMPSTSGGIANSCDAGHKCAESMTNLCPALPALPG